MSVSKKQTQASSSSSESDPTKPPTYRTRWLLLLLTLLPLCLLLVPYLMPLLLLGADESQRSSMDSVAWMITASSSQVVGGEAYTENAGFGALNYCFWSYRGLSIQGRGGEAPEGRSVLAKRQDGPASTTGGSDTLGIMDNSARMAFHLILIPILYLILQFILLIIVCFTSYSTHTSDLPVRHLLRTNPAPPTPGDPARGVPASDAKRFKAYRVLKGPIGLSGCGISAAAALGAFGAAMSMTGSMPAADGAYSYRPTIKAGNGAWMVLVALLCFLPMLWILWKKDLADPRERSKAGRSGKV